MVQSMSNIENDIIYQLSQIKEETSLHQTNFTEALTREINHLIINDFSALVQILYRMDVHEEKLKYLLKLHNNEDAANIIANLMIERQSQKIKNRQSFVAADAISDEEKW